MSKTEIYLYGARDTSTGKLVSDLTSPRKKFWQRKDDCQVAIRKATQGCWKKYDFLELVTFKLVEIEDVPDTNVGEWIKKGLSTIVCSACEYIAWDYHTTPYCPNCGARMEGDKGK